MHKKPTRRTTYRRPDLTFTEQTAIVVALTVLAVVIAAGILWMARAAW